MNEQYPIKNLCAKRVLSCHYHNFFCIKGRLQLSKEPYATYTEPFFLRVRYRMLPINLICRLI